MTRSLPPVNWFRVFESAARHLKFTAAAEELGITQSAVSQQIPKRAEEIKALKIQIPSKVGSGDKLFGSVTNADLASLISAQTSELDKKHIALPGKNIKRLGKYVATIRLHREVSFEFPFEIVPDAKA